MFESIGLRQLARQIEQRLIRIVERAFPIARPGIDETELALVEGEIASYCERCRSEDPGARSIRDVSGKNLRDR